jgi:chaperonin GroEL (HSP60 family)
VDRLTTVQEAQAMLLEGSMVNKQKHELAGSAELTAVKCQTAINSDMDKYTTGYWAQEGLVTAERVLQEDCHHHNGHFPYCLLSILSYLLN